uniref:Uncharacterized protein n=1 Tax=Lactuca sativa TaxID=4236 RepID=A0A9R1WP78_LACSA|nr:hypothetical protein LSAT_V11C100039420 [Lactuca sativa]
MIFFPKKEVIMLEKRIGQNKFAFLTMTHNLRNLLIGAIKEIREKSIKKAIVLFVKLATKEVRCYDKTNGVLTLYKYRRSDRKHMYLYKLQIFQRQNKIR